MSSTSCLNSRRKASALAGSPPIFATSAARCSSASAYAASGTKNDTASQYVSMTPRTRFPRTARTRILASTTRALPGIPLLLAGSLPDSLILLHQLVFTGAPGRDHVVKVFRCRAHGFALGLPASLLCRNIIADRLSVPHDSQRSARFHVAREFLAEFPYPDLNRFHSVYSLYTF